jgi:hypothetical protein
MDKFNGTKGLHFSVCDLICCVKSPPKLIPTTYIAMKYNIQKGIINRTK